MANPSLIAAFWAADIGLFMLVCCPAASLLGVALLLLGLVVAAAVAAAAFVVPGGRPRGRLRPGSISPLFSWSSTALTPETSAVPPPRFACCCTCCACCGRATAAGRVQLGQSASPRLVDTMPRPLQRGHAADAGMRATLPGAAESCCFARAAWWVFDAGGLMPSVVLVARLGAEAPPSLPRPSSCCKLSAASPTCPSTASNSSILEKLHSTACLWKTCLEHRERVTHVVNVELSPTKRMSPK